MYKVKQKSPWFVLGNLLILRYWDVDKTFEELDFRTSDFWVQIHGLPRGYFTLQNAFAIAQVLGNLLQTEGFGNSEPVLSYLRLKVCIDISKPLSIGFHIKGDKQNRWVSFKYERLENFCYSCGKLGHVKDDCQNDIQEGEYGPDLRAATTDPDQVNLKIKGQDGNKVFFRIKRNTQLKKLMNDYCGRQSEAFNSIAFMFDGRFLHAEQTPDQFEMEDGDEIHAIRRITDGAAVEQLLLQ